jgi:dUTP pyrophosphatase
MKLKIVLDEGAKAPTRAHSNDGGLDLYSMEDKVVPPYGSAVFNTGVHAAIPVGYVGLVKSRSGTMFGNDITTDGVVDPDYTGAIGVKLFNNCGARFVVEAGQRIAQLLIMPVITPEPEVVVELEETERGQNGFGSSGKF